jgi:hypothetical protein
MTGGSSATRYRALPPSSDTWAVLPAGRNHGVGRQSIVEFIFFVPIYFHDFKSAVEAEFLPEMAMAYA